MKNSTELAVKDGRAISECRYCKKFKAPSRMKSRHACRECINTANKKRHAKIRADLRAERYAVIDAKVYPLSQSWTNLAFVVTAP